MSQGKCVAMTGTCPHCGEAITVVFSKKELKEILRLMKMPTHNANIIAEKDMEKADTLRMRNGG